MLKDAMRKPTSFKPALSFPNQSINHFDRLIKQQLEILKIIRAALPEALANHVQHSLLNGNKLLIYTDSAAWATQLRFYEKTLLASIAHITKQADTIVQIKLVIDRVGPSWTLEKSAIIPAPEKLNAIHSYCFAAPDNELTIALLKLAKTLERIRPHDDAAKRLRNG
jgi:hypothetical protein